MVTILFVALAGTWCYMCIEQRLMKAAKSEGGLS